MYHGINAKLSSSSAENVAWETLQRSGQLLKVNDRLKVLKQSLCKYIFVKLHRKRGGTMAG